MPNCDACYGEKTKDCPEDCLTAHIRYLPTFSNASNKLCPQGWAWLIGDCDFGQNCGECQEPEAPIYANRRGSGKMEAE